MTATEYRIGAVILAGGQVPSSLRQYCSSRAQLRVNNKYLLDYLLTALQSAPSIAQMVLVAPATSLEELQHLPGIDPVQHFRAAEFAAGGGGIGLFRSRQACRIEILQVYGLPGAL